MCKYCATRASQEPDEEEIAEMVSLASKRGTVIASDIAVASPRGDDPLCLEGFVNAALGAAVNSLAGIVAAVSEKSGVPPQIVMQEFFDGLPSLVLATLKGADLSIRTFPRTKNRQG